MTVRLMLGDCLSKMKEIEDGSVDMVLCDLPYGVTRNAWDVVIPLGPLWEAYDRVCKPNGAVVLTATQPFAAVLVMSGLSRFKYEWIWQKTVKTGVLNAKRQPLREHESVLVFYRAQPTYNPQGLREGTSSGGKLSRSPNYGSMSGANRQTHTGYPGTVQKFSNPNNKNVHPTQKPVALLEYLIRTYTNEGETVLDNTMGSGSTGVAAVNTGRSFIGIERDPQYYAIAEKRIADAQGEPALFLEAAE